MKSADRKPTLRCAIYTRGASLADLRQSGKRKFAPRDFGLFLTPEPEQNGQLVVADRVGRR
jgi:hypothetical protein